MKRASEMPIFRVIALMAILACAACTTRARAAQPFTLFDSTTQFSATVDSSGNLHIAIEGPLGTQIAASSVAVTACAGCLPDLGTGSTPAAYTTNSYLQTIQGLLGNGASGYLYQAITSSIPAGSNVIGGVKVYDAGGSIDATVKAASTAAAGTDTSLVVQNSPLVSEACPLSINISQTATTQIITGTASQKIHFCAIFLISATAQGWTLEEGTGTTCAASTAYLIGGSGGTVSLAANGGSSSVAERPWLISKTAADNICLAQSGSGNISGVITYQTQ
jgi:hypothetical protein